MDFFRLSKGTHAGFDKHRGAFFWNATENKRKYRLVKWDIICKPKSLGGLGILNTQVMNTCLIVKWWWRIMTANPEALWFQILKDMYFPSGSPMFAIANGASQFWSDIIKVRDVFRAHVKFVATNRASTHFWLDWWTGDATLASSFPVLFSYCPNLEISIFELSHNGWDFGFRRSLSPEELGDWNRLGALFPALSEEADSVSWPHTTSRKFSVKSLYSRVISGPSTLRFKRIWLARVPPKIKIFLW